MNVTVLDIVQGILSKIDSDEVNSISDTADALQIADIVKDTFNSIVEELDLRSVKTLFQLTAGPSSSPTVMILPDGYHSVEWIKYNVSKDPAKTVYEVIQELPPDVFMEHVNRLTSSDSNVITVAVGGNVSYTAFNDRAPTYWATFDDVNLAFDAYDSSLEANLQTSKTNCYGQHAPTLVLDDTTPIPLPLRFMNLLRAESLAMAQDLLKNGVTPKVEQNAQRHRARAQRVRSNDRRLTAPVLPDYGRKRRG